MLLRHARVAGPRGLRSARGGVRCVHARAASITEVSVFLEEIAVSQTPKRLASLVKVLELTGYKAVGPVERAGLHPLLIPVCSSRDDKDLLTCLLRWPQPSKHPNMAMPVVNMRRGARSMKLVARSVDELLHRLLAEEDLATGEGGARPLAEAAGAEGTALYPPGTAAAEGFTGSKATLYLIRRVGKFPDVCESLAMGHMSRGDATSALVASEWYMRNSFFPGWARPYEFAAELLAPLGRDEEARDLARVALRLPWWSLSKDFATVQAAARLEGRTPEEVRYALSDEAAAAAQAQAGGRPAAPQAPKPAAQVALEKAEGLLDLVAAGARPDYDAVRGELSEAYRAAGLTDVANFIVASS